MRTRLRRIWLAGIIAVGGVAPALVVAAAQPASADPVGYTLLADFTDVGPETQGDVGAQQLPVCALATIDLGTATISPLPDESEEACVDDLTIAPDGRVFGIQMQCDNDLCPFELLDGGSTADSGWVHAAQPVADPTVHLIEFDLTTGAPTDLGPIGTDPAFTTFFLSTPFSFGGLTFDKNGNLFVEMVGEDVECDGSAFCLYRVDPADPSNAAFVGTGAIETYFQELTAGCGTPEAVTLEPDEFGIGSTEPSGFGSLALPAENILWARDLASGSTAPIGPNDVDHAVLGMEFDSDGILWGIGIDFANGPAIFTINPATGATTSVAELDLGDGPFLAIGLALPLDCPVQEEAPLVVAFTG